MKILVTGSKGFIGTHLCKKLRKLKHSITELDSKENILNNIKVIELCENQDVVIHLAAKTSVNESNINAFTYNLVNIQGTLSVLEAMRMTKVPQFIFASSAAIYEPNSVYAVTKLAGEHYTELYSYLYGFNSVILRFFNIYGKGSKGIIPIFLKNLKNNEPLTIYGGKQTRDFIHIDDVVQAIVLALDFGSKGAFNIGTGKSYSINTIANKCIKITGKSVKIIHKPKLIGEVEKSNADISLSKFLLGYKPSIKIDDGIAQMYEDLK